MANSANSNVSKTTKTTKAKSANNTTSAKSSNSTANSTVISETKSLNDSIRRFANLLSTQSGNLSTRITNHSAFDKTFYGTVVDKYDEENSDGLTVQWWVVAIENTTYNILGANSNITSIGQEVKVYVPNNNFSKMYAEVYDGVSEVFMYNHPSKAVYNSTNHTVTETWALNDGTQITRVFTLTIINEDTEDEEVTKITFPDGTYIDLEGFTTN